MTAAPLPAPVPLPRDLELRIISADRDWQAAMGAVIRWRNERNSLNALAALMGFKSAVATLLEHDPALRERVDQAFCMDAITRFPSPGKLIG